MRVVRVDKFLQEQDKVTWLVDELLPNVGWTLFYGLRGIGKTTFAMQLCNSLQTGTPFMERRALKTSTLYLQADSVVAEWREMLKRIVPKTSTAFTIVEVPNKCLDTPDYVLRLINYVQTFKPGYVVFDSLYNLTGRSINTESVLIAIQAMKDVCGTVPWMLVHHPPHNESRAAGHHSLGGNCSNEWSLLKTKLKIEKGRLVKDKEISLTRDSEGLWQLYKKADVAGINSRLYNRAL